jgi:hypothetical protein
MIQLTAALLALLPPGGIDSTVLPEPVSRARMEREIFDPRWLIPRATAAELAASPKGTVDLVAELRALLARRFEPAGGSDALARATTLGDLVALFAPIRDDRKAVDALLERLEDERPEVWEQVGWALHELVRERRFLSGRWDPDDDRGDDGFLIAKPRDLALVEGGPWKKVEGSTLAVQVATLIHADLGAIKAAENDFRTWPDRIGADYERIRPIPDSYLRGELTDGNPFAALKVEFTCDIPFPFGTYDCDLRMLHRLDEDGCLISDVMSPSRDFYWLAGHDLFLPVIDSQGEWVSMLAVRVFGCDLRGVPDADSHHEAGAREGLGNMKREAEKLWRSADPRDPLYEGSVPVFTVHGP